MLATLGYPVAPYWDSDRPLTPDETRDIAAAGVMVFQYDGTTDTETALFTAASDAQVQALLDYARGEVRRVGRGNPDGHGCGADA